MTCSAVAVTPYLYKLLDDRDYDVTCHNNLSRAIAPYHMTSSTCTTS